MVFSPFTGSHATKIRKKPYRKSLHFMDINVKESIYIMQCFKL